MLSRSRSRLATALAVTAVPAALTAWLIPRGPWSCTAAPLTIASCAAAGYAAGRLSPSAWVRLGPIVFGAVLELGRLDVVGPTVDLPAADQLRYPITWFVALAPRALHVLLAGVPMLVGLRIARTADHRPMSVRAWWPAAALLALTALVSVPPTTAPIPGGIAEFRTVSVNGRSETMLLRGQDASAPVLLWLSGGPGGTELGMTPEAFADLESDFVVVTWDQAGAGLSASALPRHGMDLSDSVDDTLAVAEYLCTELGHDKVYLAGNSGGTLVGVLAVHERPDLFAAFIGSGQMVDVQATDQMMYADALSWATTHDPSLQASLESFGPPPYPSREALSYLTVLGSYGRSPGPAPSTGGTFPANLASPELGPMGAVGSLFGMVDTFAVTYRSFNEVDLRVEAAELEVPVYLVQGAYEHPGRQVPAREWFDMLKAPRASWTQVPTAGHRSMAQDPGTWAATVRRAARDTGSV